MENMPFFRADMAGLGKYCMGGYGRIGVYRVNKTDYCVALYWYSRDLFVYNVFGINYYLKCSLPSIPHPSKSGRPCRRR